MLAINSEDDERNPPQTGITADAMGQLRNSRLYLVPASAQTRGHGTVGMARFWADQLAAFLAAVPKRAD